MNLEKLLREGPCPETDMQIVRLPDETFHTRVAYVAYGDMTALARSLERRLAVAVGLLEREGTLKHGSDARDEWISEVHAALHLIRGPQ